MEHSRSDDLIAIGKIHSARGIKGEIKVKPLTDFPGRFKDIDRVRLERSNGEIEIHIVVSAAVHGDVIVMKLEGIDDRDKAESLRGSYMSVTRDETVELERDAFYMYDLIGLDICNTAGDKIGKIRDIERYPANDVIIAETIDRVIMIPAVKQFVVDVDIPGEKITVDLPEGLPDYPDGKRAR